MLTTFYFGIINRELVGFAEGNWASAVILRGPSGREHATRDLFDVQPGLGGDRLRARDLCLTKENPFVSQMKVEAFWWLCGI